MTIRTVSLCPLARTPGSRTCWSRQEKWFSNFGDRSGIRPGFSLTSGHHRKCGTCDKCQQPTVDRGQILLAASARRLNLVPTDTMRLLHNRQGLKGINLRLYQSSSSLADRDGRDRPACPLVEASACCGTRSRVCANAEAGSTQSIRTGWRRSAGL